MKYSPNDIVVNKNQDIGMLFFKVISQISKENIRVSLLEKTGDYMMISCREEEVILGDYYRLATKEEINHLNKRLTFK